MLCTEKLLKVKNKNFSWGLTAYFWTSMPKMPRTFRWPKKRSPKFKWVLVIFFVIFTLRTWYGDSWAELIAQPYTSILKPYRRSTKKALIWISIIVFHFFRRTAWSARPRFSVHSALFYVTLNEFCDGAFIPLLFRVVSQYRVSVFPLIIKILLDYRSILFGKAISPILR